LSNNLTATKQRRHDVELRFVDQSETKILLRTDAPPPMLMSCDPAAEVLSSSLGAIVVKPGLALVRLAEHRVEHARAGEPAGGGRRGARPVLSCDRNGAIWATLRQLIRPSA
jgi:hypothetical protein